MTSIHRHIHPHTVTVRWADHEPWEDQVEFMESWLDTNIGAGTWSWSWYSLRQCFYCGVEFAHERDLCVFLLYFSSGVVVLPSTSAKST